jgi:ABC-type Mn2+/Zn2+ transport system permease subunit
MQRGLIAATLVGVLCAVVGCYVVLRGMAFLGDALAHAILPGVAIAYLFNGNLLLGALIAAVVVALLIGILSRQGTIKEDTAIGILFAAALSLGVLLISIRTYAVDRRTSCSATCRRGAGDLIVALAQCAGLHCRVLS